MRGVGLCTRGCSVSKMFLSIADGSGNFCGPPSCPQAWDEPKYQEEGVKVCGALLAVCYNPDTQVQILCSLFCTRSC